MKISKQARRDAKALFRACLEDGNLSEPKVRQTVQSVTEKKPRGYIAILNHFLRLVKTDIQNRTATVESAVALDANEQSAIKQQLIGKYGDSLVVSFTQNQALIGGLRIQVGSDVYDGSVRSRLHRIGDAFSVAS